MICNKNERPRSDTNYSVIFTGYVLFNWPARGLETHLLTKTIKYLMVFLQVI